MVGAGGCAAALGGRRGVAAWRGHGVVAERWYGSARTARLGASRFAATRLGSASIGTARLHPARLGSAWVGPAVPIAGIAAASRRHSGVPSGRVPSTAPSDSRRNSGVGFGTIP